MKNLKIIPIKEMDIVLSNSLEIVRGGVTFECGTNSCSGNSGNCKTNKCQNNELGCDFNECRKNLCNLCRLDFVAPPCLTNGCGSLKIE